MQFYEFGNTAFRDELRTSFIQPAITWLYGEKTYPYLLPQISGSHWECAIAIESLLTASDLDQIVDSELRKLLENKVFMTVTWLIDQISHDDEAQTCNWDDATWDTAICARCIFTAEKWFKTKWNDEQLQDLRKIRTNLVRWLVERGINWDKDVRYPAGPPDLAQVLNTLLLVYEHNPEELSNIEQEIQLDNDETVIDRITRIIMSMEEKSVLTLSDGNVDVSYWVDCFNTSEVVEGLAAYMRHCSTTDNTQKNLAKSVKAALYRSIRYIEENQDNGTWGGVADSCGTLYGYLHVTETLTDIEPKDYIVFQALRWMCDKNQVFSDGSFLHSSYITVFYLLALLKAYEKWELGYQTTLEVYDIALWNIPAQGSAERSKRLELQLALEDRNHEIGMLDSQNISLRKRIDIAKYLTFEFIIFLFLLIVSNIISVDWLSLDFNIVNTDRFIAALGIGFAVALAIIPIQIAKKPKHVVRGLYTKEP